MATMLLLWQQMLIVRCRRASNKVHTEQKILFYFILRHFVNYCKKGQKTTPFMMSFLKRLRFGSHDNSAMALYLKMFVMIPSNFVSSFMLLSSKAQNGEILHLSA